MVEIPACKGYSMVKFFETGILRNFLWERIPLAKECMSKKEDSEKLIGKLIKKRKDENKAFAKILNALEGKSAKGQSKKKS